MHLRREPTSRHPSVARPVRDVFTCRALGAAGSPDLLPSPTWWFRASLLVAASGGLDSTVLLDLLARYARECRELRIGAAYLDHGWRGYEARLDGDLVGDFCARRGLPFFRAEEDVPALARRWGLSPEAAARAARYVFLARVARRNGFAAVATAHHAGDQTETLLLRLERGERGEGLAGIRPFARIAGVEVVRPLLAAQPRELLAYAEARRLAFREDATNADLRFPRNRLRLRGVDRVLREDVRQLTRLAALERRFLENVAERVEGALLAVGDIPRNAAGGTAARDRDEATGALSFRVAPLFALDARLRREVLRRVVRRVSGHPDLPAGALGLLERLLASRKGGRAHLRGARAAASCGWLHLEAVPSAGGVGRLSTRSGASGAGGVLPAREETVSVEAFDPAGIEGLLVLRTRLPGDRIEVRLSAEEGGVAWGRKKLKEVFREARVPVWLRDRYPVLADDRGVLWVVGLRRSDRARPQPGAPVLRIRISELPFG